MSEPQASATILPADKVKTFPTTAGLYLMKDAQGRVIYVGKAKNLRAGWFVLSQDRRAGSPNLRLD